MEIKSTFFLDLTIYLRDQTPIFTPTILIILKYQFLITLPVAYVILCLNLILEYLGCRIRLSVPKKCNYPNELIDDRIKRAFKVDRCELHFEIYIF